MSIQRLFFAWDRPPLDWAVEFLTKAWSGDGTLDLSDWIVVVPTRHTGRRLRERLAVFAASHQSAVIPGQIIAPESLFRPEESARPFTDALSALLLWRDIVDHLSPKDCPTLFPEEKLHCKFEDRNSLPEQLYNLRERLCEEGHSIRSFANLYDNNPEADRWADLCLLEDRFLALAESHGLQDLCEAKIRASRSPNQRFFESKHFCILFVPDPVPLAAQTITRLAKQRMIDVCIHAPDSLDNTFDDIGRPLLDHWTSSNIPVASENIILSQQPHRMLTHIGDHLASLSLQERTQCTIGVPDASLVAPMQEMLTGQDIDNYNPAGTPAAQGILFHLLEALFNLLTTNDYDAVASFMRHPVFLKYMKSFDNTFSSGRFLRDLDCFQNNHIPNGYRSFLSFATNEDWYPEVIKLIADIRSRLEKDSAGALFDILRMLFSEKSFKKTDKSDCLILNSVEVLRQKIASLQSCPLVEQLGSHDKLLFLMQEFRRMRITTERSLEAVDLMGWLELHWDDSPQLLLCGMNDGVVPETIVGHIFIPDQACVETGLRTNRTRLARDAYLLQAIIACRAPNQVIHFLSKQSFNGDPLRPSRLLLMVPDKELLERVNLLFGDAKGETSTPPHCHDWFLEPQVSSAQLPMTDISVSAINEYLQNPLLCFLKHILKMQPQDDRKAEMNAGDFGEMCHKAFEFFSKSSYANSSVAEEIEEVLLTQAGNMFTAQYGDDLSVPLMLQKEGLFSRLRTAARIQAAWRLQGWCIEQKFSEKDLRIPLTNGLFLKGRIDRIDRNENDGRLCIIDYKSSDNAVDPAKRHIGRANNDTPAYAMMPDGKNRWNNIQLTAYLLMARYHLPELADRLCCAFFNLPRTPSGTSIEIWDAITHELTNSAESCIKTIAANIQQGIFPASGRLRYDDEFRSLLFDNPEEVMVFPSSGKEAQDV